MSDPTNNEYVNGKKSTDLDEGREIPPENPTGGTPLFRGTTPNDLVTPAWNAVMDETATNQAASAQDSTWSEDRTTQEDLEADQADDINLEVVPDADAISVDSPIDPAAPPVEIVHGTDLLNGAGADDPE